MKIFVILFRIIIGLFGLDNLALIILSSKADPDPDLYRKYIYVGVSSLLIMLSFYKRF